MTAIVAVSPYNLGKREFFQRKAEKGRCEMKYGKLDLGQIEAIVNKLGGMEGVQRFLRGELTLKETDLLRQVATVAVKGAERFVARDHLQTANVGWTSDNFQELFLDKAEEGVKDATIAVHRLERDSLDAPIRAELGSRAETKLAYFFELLEKQSKGEKGTLLTNGHANIAYIKGNDGNLWAVYADWNSGFGYWSVSARLVENPYGWSAGGQVLSCDS